MLLRHSGFLAQIEAPTASWCCAPRGHYGHRDGGELVRKLYGHSDAKLARERVRRAFRDAPPTPVPLVAVGR